MTVCLLSWRMVTLCHDNIYTVINLKDTRQEGGGEWWRERRMEALLYPSLPSTIGGGREGYMGEKGGGEIKHVSFDIILLSVNERSYNLQSSNQSNRVLTEPCICVRYWLVDMSFHHDITLVNCRWLFSRKNEDGRNEWHLSNVILIYFFSWGLITY